MNDLPTTKHSASQSSAPDSREDVITQGRFPVEIEKAFQADFFQRNIRNQRGGLLLLLLILMIGGLLYLEDPPAGRRYELLIHYLVLCPIFAALYPATYLPRFQFWAQQVMGAVTLLFGFAMIVLEEASPTPSGSAASQTTTLLILVIMAVTVGFRLRYHYALTCCIVLFVTYAGAAFGVFHLPHAVWNVSMVFIAACLGSLGAKLMENRVRNEFLLRRALSEQNRRLDELANARLQSARDVEHEIKNKLSAIGKPIEVAIRGMDRGVETARNRLYLDDALRGVRELEELLQMLLNITRMEAGYPPSLEEPQCLPLEEIVRQVCEHKKAEILLRREANNLTTSEVAAAEKILPEICVEISLAPIPLSLHASSLQLVLENLIDNAVKYSLKGGTITISVWETSEELFVSVADQGIGVAAERLEGLFNSPYQRGRAEEYHILGTGIGMHMIKRLVDAQEGRIWAESAGEGHGTTVFLTLPRKPE